MKRIMIVILSLCLLLPSLAFADSWLCPNCGVQRTGAFCPECGAMPSQAAPTITVDEIGKKYIEFSWTGFAGAQEYRVYIRTSNGDDWELVQKTPLTNDVINNLAPGTAYDVRVRSDNQLEAVLKGIKTSGQPEPTPSPAPTATPYVSPTPKPTARPTAKPTSTPKAVSVRVGQYVSFGHYPQTKGGRDKTAIEWKVLDVKGTSALLLSRYSLDVKPYNQTLANVTWESCTLRRWLNNDFLNSAFSTEERSAIKLTNVDNSQSQGFSGWNTRGGNNTQDKVFLLSATEAQKYLGLVANSYWGSVAYNSVTTPTEYAVAHGAYTYSKQYNQWYEGYTWWWLRSPGYLQNYAAYAGLHGLSRDQVSVKAGGVRPVIWVDLTSGLIKLKK